MLVGALAQMVLGRSGYKLDWAMALVAGLVGSFVGGLLVSLLAGDGLALEPSGLIGSFVGAVIVTAAWIGFDKHNKAEATAERRR